MPTSMLTYRYRIKDPTRAKHLQRLAWAVNRVWNYCNLRREVAYMIVGPSGPDLLSHQQYPTGYGSKVTHCQKPSDNVPIPTKGASEL
jgi:hypothetical protein